MACHYYDMLAQQPREYCACSHPAPTLLTLFCFPCFLSSVIEVCFFLPFNFFSSSFLPSPLIASPVFFIPPSLFLYHLCGGNPVPLLLEAGTLPWGCPCPPLLSCWVDQTHTNRCAVCPGTAISEESMAKSTAPAADTQWAKPGELRKLAAQGVTGRQGQDYSPPPPGKLCGFHKDFSGREGSVGAEPGASDVNPGD